MTKAAASLSLVPAVADGIDLHALVEEVRALREDLRSALARLAPQSNGASVDTTSTTDAGDDLLTVDDVCARLHVCRRTLQRLRKLGEIPEPRKIGGSLRWHRKDLDRCLGKKAG